MFASKTTLGFYDPEINTEIPEDAVEISKEFHMKLLEGQSAGLIIDWEEGGMPFLRPPTPLTVAELNELAIINRQLAYVAEADPLFYQYQRKDVTKQEWLDKIAEIKLRFPKVEETQ